MDLNEGEVYVLLGPNGAGKTTLAKTICGILLPEKGDVLINGESVVKNPRIAKEKVGIVFEEVRNTYHYLTVEANLKYFGYLNCIPKKVLDQRINK
ncbi:ATP-binding cassette domain-containing protein [Candidatus Acetothermia bacterium]|nr:ATP-binding cassette domain-containing protein [Candidatus Acetothermia bacterium]MCI2428829.1 ATP-binding cassette domain-containing protein [Candidatus Acetothermia bacterium]